MAYAYKGKKRDLEVKGHPKCGTDAGYQRHKYYKTPKCQPCKDAHSAAQSAWLTRKHTTMRGQCATYPGYMRHKRAGEQPCGMCLDAYAQYMRAYRERKAAA